MTNKSIYLHLFIPKQRCSMRLLFSYQNVEHMSTTSGSGPHMLSKQFPTVTVRVLTYSGASGERCSAMCVFICVLLTYLLTGFQDVLPRSPPVQLLLHLPPADL